MLDDFAYKTEQGVINGAGGDEPTGLMSGGTPFELGAENAVEADEIIKIFHTLKAPFMPGAKWLMNRNALCAIRLLKGEDGQYLFHEADLTSGYAGYILGKPILLSEVIDDFTILFGDFGRAYKANVNPSMTIQLLTEKYATMGAKGVLGFLWLDGRPVNNDAYVVAKAEEDTQA
jgi:HK97 family phage major capsid protein